MSLLKIKNLFAGVEEQNILQGVDLEIKPGEIHAIMGPNGSGKSTLSNVIMGNPTYSISQGDVQFEGESIKELEPNERSHKGIFMVFQSPRAIQGANMRSFLHTIYKSKILTQKGMTADEAKKDKDTRRSISIATFKKLLREKLPEVKVKEEFMERHLNEGFSGGEKKKSEVLQMKLLKPKLAILDELDSGLDVDSLRICCEEIKKIAKEENIALLIVTHFTRIFDYIQPDFVHKFKNGKIVETGDISLAHKIEEEGYEDNKK